jgi:hypothetical protein
MLARVDKLAFQEWFAFSPSVVMGLRGFEDRRHFHEVGPGAGDNEEFNTQG